MMANAAQIQNGVENRCVGVHYVASLADATAHFESRGFNGILKMRVRESSIGCNEARRRVNDIANRGEAMAFYDGGWDAACAARCNIYEFEFSSFDGDTTSDPAYIGFVTYRGED